MKKNLFTVFALALLSLILFLPMSARAESITTAVVRTRLDELKEMVGDFFTADERKHPYGRRHAARGGAVLRGVQLRAIGILRF